MRLTGFWQTNVLGRFWKRSFCWKRSDRSERIMHLEGRCLKKWNVFGNLIHGMVFLSEGMLRIYCRIEKETAGRMYRSTVCRINGFFE